MRLKSSSLVLVVISSMLMPICNRFHERLADSVKMTTSTGVLLFDAFVAGFLKPGKWRLGPSKSRSMLKIPYAASPCQSRMVSTQFAVEMCLATRNRQKSIKTLFWRSRSFKVIEFGGNQEPVYDFLLVINSNLGPISHRYRVFTRFSKRPANF